MKTLSPSGVELEIMGLTSFDFSEDMQSNPNHYVSSQLMPNLIDFIFM